MNYIKDLWDKYNNEEFILSDIYNKKIFRKNLDGMNTATSCSITQFS